jgi:hypothetical protein
MSQMRYHCKHHDREEASLAEVSHHYCGCDGTTHLACLGDSRLAPAGTPRPASWPIFLSWRTAPVVAAGGPPCPAR